MPMRSQWLSMVRLESRFVPANLLVTDAGDNGAVGQLRTLLTTANSNNEADTITFHTSVASIALTDALPTYTEDRALTIVGNGKLATTINAATGKRIFAFNVPGAQPTISIRDLALHGGSTAAHGGAILDDNETLALTNLRFSQNVALAGGAVAVEAASTMLTVAGCDFTANTATNTADGQFLGGGGIYLGGSAAVTINNSTFDANVAGTGGSALASANVALNLTSDSCTFMNGQSTGKDDRSGGALFFSGGATTVVLDHATVTGNSTAYRGGMIFNYNAGADITIKNSTIGANTADHPGGAIYIYGSGSKLTVQATTFTANSSPVSGGAVYSSQATLNIANSIFSGNTTGSQAGAVYSNGGTASITVSVFQNNVAATAGGAMRLAGVNTINACDFSFNTSGTSGGAIQAASAMTVAGSTFRGNTAGSSGGAISSASTLTVSQCTFNKNTAAGAAGGGAIAHSSSAPLTINNGTIYDNSATSSSTTTSGAGIVRTGTGLLAISSTIIAGNKLTAGTSSLGRDIASAVTITIAGNNCLIGTNDNSGITLTGPYQAGTNAAPLNPLLNGLADNGGVILPDGNTVKTMSLQPTSPALNQGNNTAGFTYDQRGSGFTRTSGAADVGAFEVQSGAPMPPTVLSVTFGDGATQRSLVKRIVVTFSESVTFMGGVASSFTLHRSGTGGATGDVALAADPVAGPASSVTITFTGGFTELSGTLIDGFYNFTIDAAQVSGAGGALDGNNDAIPGGSYSVTGTTTNKYFRLYGDSNGDGVTNLADFAAFRSSFNLGPNSIFDLDNDGNVGLGDFAAFQMRFNLSP